MLSKRKLLILCLPLALGICQGSMAKTIARMQVEDGGKGPYKAEIVKDNKLEGYTIIKPVDMKSAAAIEGRLPVILFGNGGCARSTDGFFNFLTNIASRGYVIVTNGIFSEPLPWKEEPAQTTEKGSAESQQPQSPMSREAMMEGFRKAEKQNVADAMDYLRALDILGSEASNKKSEYYQAIDTHNSAAMGQSCGGGQALILGCSGDTRIRTTIALNSGVAYLDDENTWMLKKEDLQNLGGPILYLEGGKTDVAYPNGTDDYKLIKHVPVALASLEVGHGGTYSQPGGGSFADMAILWLDLQLKGKQENEDVFRFSALPSYLWEEGWVMYSKNFDEAIEMKLWDESPAVNTEKVTYNVVGEESTVIGVNDPGMKVYLPEKDKANGTAVLIYAGGAMVSLSMEGETKQISRWLNNKGIAAVVVKYRLRDMSQMTVPAPAGSTDNKFLRMQGRIYDFAELDKANTNPQEPDPDDLSMDYAADDANRAIELVREHAAEWGIDPDKVGVLGFSAGGAVELAGYMKADKAHRPSFIATMYGPSCVDIEVPADAPKLFVAVHADHPNVAAGCLALFMEWKKAGVDAELHVYDRKTGNFFGSAGSGESNPYGGSWMEPFYAWLCANGFGR